MGIVLSIITLFLGVIFTILTLKNWEKGNNITTLIPLIMLIIGSIFSILHLKADLSSISTSITPKSYTMYILLCYAVIFIFISSTTKSNEINKQKAAVEEVKSVGAIIGVSMYLIDGLNLPANSLCKLLLFNDYLLIKNASNTFKLNITQMYGAYGKTNKEIIEQEKSSVGRAIVGGVILGPVGAIVGGLSGVGTKTKQILVHLMIVTYRGSDGELKALVFKPEQNPNNPNPALETILTFEHAIKQLLSKKTVPEVIEL